LLQRPLRSGRARHRTPAPTALPISAASADGNRAAMTTISLLLKRPDTHPGLLAGAAESREFGFDLAEILEDDAEE
jgi:hypothetical protein